MAETTKERTERTTEQAFQRAEDTMGSLFDNSRRTMQAVMEYNRNSFSIGYEFARTVQEESMRQTDAWIDHVTRFQKSYFKSFQECANRFQDLSEKMVRENNDRLEETLDQSMEMVTPGMRPGSGKRR